MRGRERGGRETAPSLCPRSPSPRLATIAEDSKGSGREKPIKKPPKKEIKIFLDTPLQRKRIFGII